LEGATDIMASTNSRKIFVNLPVRDLKKSMNFFSALGFQFNKQFTNDQGACMVISEDAYVMLLSEPFFKTFTKQALCDTSKATEGLFALSCESKAEVDQLVKKAVAAGGRYAMDAQDNGFMYGWSFYDLDGHHWEVLWMDPAHIHAPEKSTAQAVQ
jgi:predicted lactoylglutathione lyase